MFGLILGILVLIAGIAFGVYAIVYEHHAYKADRYGNYLRDDNGNPLVASVDHPLRKFAPASVVAGVLLAALLIFAGCIASVPTGHTGVVTTFGKVEDKNFDAGFNMKAPWQKVVTMDNRVQKLTTALSCFSSDIQEVSISYTLNYQIDKANAQEIYRNVGTAYTETVILPNIAESVKDIVAQYTAEQIVGSRADLASAINVVLTEGLARYNIQVVSTAIEDMDFTDAFTNAVEAKQVAAQNKLQAEIEQAQRVMEQQAAAEMTVIQANAAAETAKIQAQADAETAKIKAQADLEVVKIEADGVEYAGQKEAAANKALADSLTESLLQYYYVQNWDGKLPNTYVGSEDVSAIITGSNNSK